MQRCRDPTTTATTTSHCLAFRSAQCTEALRLVVEHGAAPYTRDKNKYAMCVCARQNHGWAHAKSSWAPAQADAPPLGRTGGQ
jgi:CDP-diacylglycerol pyrophosphatase